MILKSKNVENLITFQVLQADYGCYSPPPTIKDNKETQGDCKIYRCDEAEYHCLMKKQNCRIRGFENAQVNVEKALLGEYCGLQVSLNPNILPYMQLI